MLIRCIRIRRYRTFIIFGCAILSAQLVILYMFLYLNEGQLLQHSRNGAVNSAAHPVWPIDDEDSASNSDYRKSLKMQNSHIRGGRLDNPSRKKSNKSQLYLEELDFTPDCEIQTREAISAINRAKTQSCKQEISWIVCLMERNKLYPSTLPSHCLSQNHKKGRSIGCYRDQKDARILSGSVHAMGSEASVSYCIHLCSQSGHPYAGLQYKTECWCGSEKPNNSLKIDNSNCDMRCEADPDQFCGGYFTANIYETGLGEWVAPTLKTYASGDNGVRIVFLFSLNGRAVRQVRRLLSVLYHPSHYYYLHIDARQEYLYRELLQLEDSYSNIRLVRDRLSTIWGGATLLKMMLQAMDTLLDMKEWRWDYIINLSESDFPIKNTDKLSRFLTSNKGMNFLKSHGRDSQKFIQKQGLDRTFIECDKHMWRVGDRSLPRGIWVDGGSDWFSLHRDFVEYVVRTDDELVSGLKTIFELTILPAESFFHTVIRNSVFCSTFVDNNLHITNWKRKKGCLCQYKHIVDWCGCSPSDFLQEDFNKLQATSNRPLFFARKFEAQVCQRIITQVEEWISPTKVEHSTSADSFWLNLYHHLDSTPPDDASVTAYTSWARLAARRLSDKISVNVSAGRALEANAYFNQDQPQGVLLLFEVEGSSGDTESLEVRIKPTLVNEILPVGEGYRLKSIRVTSDYDQKENNFRNYGAVMGPWTEELVLVTEWGPGAGVNFTALWVDPALAAVAATFIKHEALDEPNVIKLPMQTPLRPGVWEVYIIQGRHMVAKVQFLVTPLQGVDAQQARLLHSGPAQPYSSGDLSRYDMFLDEARRESLSRRAYTNSRRFGLDLREWIDSLYSIFYEVVGLCVASHSSSLFQNLSSCYLTSWSSLFPDPKSAFNPS